MKYNPEPLLLYPYAYGPSLRGQVIPLLWSGQLVTFLPGFVTSNPSTHYFAAMDRMQLSPLAPVFVKVAEHAYLAKTQVDEELKNLEPLGKRILKALPVLSGTKAAYSALENLPAPVMQACHNMLGHTQVMNVASVEFIWRFYELSLEMGAAPEQPLSDPSPVIEYLELRASDIGSGNALLAECLLNRLNCLYGQAGTTSSLPGLVTDSPDNLELLSRLGDLVAGDELTSERASEVVQSQLAFTLFSAALTPLWKPIESPFAMKLSQIFDSKTAELKAARQHCLNEAGTLLAQSLTEAQLKNKVTTALKGIKEEVKSITRLDNASYKKVFNTMTEDVKVWGCIAAMIGSAAGTLPPVTSAAAAATAFSLLGSAALKESRERKKKLHESKWALAYYLAK